MSTSAAAAASVEASSTPAVLAHHTKRLITELEVVDLQKLQAEMGNKVLIIKFGAEWCGPCKRIAPTFHNFISGCPTNIIFADIDVDENLDLYIALKKNKMVNGIPAFLAFYGDKIREKWFIPDDSVTGADETTVNQFFDRCRTKAVDLISKQPTPYSYYT